MYEYNILTRQYISSGRVYQAFIQYGGELLFRYLSTMWQYVRPS